MNSTSIRHTAATLVTATAAVLAIGTVSPSPAGASRPVPDIGPTTVGSSTGSMDIDGVVTTLKVQRAQYLITHPSLLR